METTPPDFSSLLAAHLETFRKECPPLSDKQKQYLTSLILSSIGKNFLSQVEKSECQLFPGSAPRPEVPLEDGELFEIISNYLEKEVSSWNAITSDDFSKLIWLLSKKVPLYPGQVLHLQAIFSIENKTEKNPLEEISKRLGREIRTWEELAYSDYKNLLRNPSRFHLIPNLRPLRCSPDWEYGVQSYPGKEWQMFYLKFYNFMMLDYDNISYDSLLEKLKPWVKVNFYFVIYETKNGYHVFVMNLLFPHEEQFSLQMMKSFGCDYFYCLFSHKFGYAIRLNKKPNRDEEFVARSIGNLGNPQNALPECLEYLALHDEYLKIVSQKEERREK